MWYIFSIRKMSLDLFYVCFFVNDHIDRLFGCIKDEYQRNTTSNERICIYSRKKTHFFDYYALIGRNQTHFQ
jgi:hypothetical protein